MNTQAMSLEQIRIAGMEALARELGVVGMIRFLQQFETGYGGERSKLGTRHVFHHYPSNPLGF
jgi:hypothetical protein